jgi:hypothetical protein
MCRPAGSINRSTRQGGDLQIDRLSIPEELPAFAGFAPEEWQMLKDIIELIGSIAQCFEIFYVFSFN